MRTGSQVVIIIAKIFFLIILTSGAIAELIGGSTAIRKKSVSVDGSNSSKEVTWKVFSNSDANVPVVAIGLSKVISVRPGFSLVWVNDGYAASDYGPYNRLFLVYHSRSEYPHYKATFFLGNIHSIGSVKSLDGHMILVETNLHVKLPRAHRVHMSVDLAELNNAIKNPPEEEGNMDVSVKVTITEALTEMLSIDN